MTYRFGHSSLLQNQVRTLTCRQSSGYIELRCEPLSSSGLGRSPLKAKTRVRLPLGVCEHLDSKCHLVPQSVLTSAAFAFVAMLALCDASQPL